ncbi:MAG TPA: hemolysin III family protein [Saliniramus sp.]|nr:hemolysin III family protein [Saliniramus sp.]
MHSPFKPPIAVKWQYDRAELIADAVVHVVGVIAAVIAVLALLALAAGSASGIEMAALALYAFGLIAVKLISAVYNMWPITPFKWALRRFDHAAIYILIAGTYTPFLTQIESGPAFWALAGILWITAAIGVALKIWLPGRFDRLAIALYLGLGWSGMLAIEAVVEAVPTTSLWLIVIGGITYSLGVIFHVWESLRFHNAIWHVFVLAASGFLYWAVLDTMVIARL